MKKPIVLLLLLSLGGLMQSLSATPVDVNKARHVALNFLRTQGVERATLTDLTEQTPFRAFYTFAIEDEGFILVSADDATAPILGFSLSNGFPAERMPDHVASWLREYVTLIEYNQEHAAAAHPDWALLGSGVPFDPPHSTSVSPLLSTTWDQSPYYNNLCPYDNSYNERTVTGCVATATAQVMKFWNHPTTGYGSHSYTDNGYNNVSYGTLSANFGQTTYQWSQMPNQLTASSSSAQVNAVATLMYHIGVADEMTYGVSAVGGSAASNYSSDGQYNTPSSQNSLIEYFKYAPDMNIVDRDRFSATEFCSILRGDLDAGHPILYSGRDPSGGHSFVIDGYNQQGQFHVNWGWGGWYDGYFYIGALNPGSSGTGGTASDQYNLRNVALTNIHPNNSWSSTGTTTVSATATAGGTVTGGGSYPFGSVVSLEATANSGNRFAHWNDGGSCASLSFKATGGSYTYQGHFESILHDDTISYCGNGNLVSGFGDPYGNTTFWGMRVPAGVGAGSQLTAVQLYVRSAGSYTVYVCDGVSSFSENYIYTGNHSFSTTGWQTITLPTPYTLDATKTLWVAFSSTAAYPAAVTSYSGNAEGSLWGSSLTLLNQPYTFMIRAITGDSTGGGTTGCGPYALPYACGFESASDFLCWSSVDQDNDGNNWERVAYTSNNANQCAHTGSYFMTSASYMNNGSGGGSPLTPNNWLISPEIVIPAGGATLSWWVAAQDANWPGEHYKVMLSTTAGTTPSAFSQTLHEETLATADWTQHSATIANAGTVRLAFVHCNCTDMFRINLDDVTIVANSGGGNDTIPMSDCDSVVYDNGTYNTSVGAGGSLYWGIRIPASRLASINNSLRSVRVYSSEATTSTLTVASGSATAPSSNLRTLSVSLQQGWNSIALTTPVSIPASGDMWVTLHNNVTTYPAAMSSNFTTTDACQVSTDGAAWADLATLSGGSIANGSWMIRAIFCEDNGDTPPPPPTQYTITANSNNPAWGTVTGGGTYNQGATTTLTATANTGYHFVSWQDGNTQNPRTITVTGNATYTATFAQNSGGGCGPYSLPYSYGFEEEDEFQCWRLADQDGDGNNWDRVNYTGENANQCAHSGSYYMSSASYINNSGSLTPNNWLISPEIIISTGGATLTWWVAAQDANWPQEHYKVMLSTTAGTTPSAFSQTLHEETLTSGNWTQHSVAIPNSGTVRIAFVHCNCTDMFRLNLDDIAITAGYTPTTYTITANSNNNAWGTVTGGGTYEEGTQVTLTATANTGYYFQRWQDGNTQNPRVITVTGNATYTAMFAKEQTQGIDDAEEEAEVLSVEYYDVLGRRLQAEPARGVYLVRTLTTQGAQTQKIVKY